MADTGAPWNLPYPLPTDLVRDGADAIEDLAEATADGLSAAGGLVAVKHAIKTNTFSSGSLAPGANEAIPGLSLAHAVETTGNVLIITCVLGHVSTVPDNGFIGLAVFDGTTAIGVGDADGSRTRVSTGGLPRSTFAGSGTVLGPLVFTFAYEPPDDTERTYTARVVNAYADPQTFRVNRTLNDTNAANFIRSASSLVIQEVKV